MSCIHQQQVEQARSMVAAARSSYNPGGPSNGDNGAALTRLVKALRWLDSACTAGSNAYGSYGATASDRVIAARYREEARAAGSEAFRLDPTPRHARGVTYMPPGAGKL